MVLFYHRQLFHIKFSQSITFQIKRSIFFYLWMLILCFGSLMVRSLLIPRLILFMTGLFWFCSRPFVSVPALIFILIFPLEQIFLSTGFFDFPNEATHIGLLLFDSMALPDSCIILLCIFSNSLLYTGIQVGPCQHFKQSWEYFFNLFVKWSD